jgi:hypothetical protein
MTCIIPLISLVTKLGASLILNKLRHTAKIPISLFTLPCARRALPDAGSSTSQIKTSFPSAFCYTTMPFGLKSAGATYQRGIQWYLHS